MADLAGALAAIEARLSENWTTTPIAFTNQGVPPAAVIDGVPTPWIMCEVETFDAEIKGAGLPGSHTVVDSGEVMITVYVPSGEDRAEARTHAVAVGEIFRVKEFYQSAGACVRTWTPQVGGGAISSSENPSGNWWGVPVAIPFEFIRYI